jgi:hypothetical protein
VNAPASNPYADAARAAKAGRISAHLASIGVTAGQARTLDGQGRAAAEKLAGVRRSSDACWEIVFSNLTPRPDPFEGLPGCDR